MLNGRRRLCVRVQIFHFFNEAAMSSLQYLRDLITRRLTFAAEEIFRGFEQTVIKYEEEVDRQRKLLEIVCKPRVKLQRIEHLQQNFHKEGEVLSEQQLCNQVRNSSLEQEEPESLQLKEEQEEFCTSPEGEQLEVKQEADTLMFTPDNKESDHMILEPGSDHQLLSHSSPVAESQDQTGSKHVDSVSHRNVESKPHKRSERKNVDNRRTSETESESHTVKKYFKCDSYGFAHEPQLVRHVRVHTGDKPFPCTTCAKCFRTKCMLLSHMRTHTNEKPYSCKMCGKCFRRSWDLVVHERIHTGEKPYMCKACGKCFRVRGYWKTHELTHTDKKPYSCKICGKCFTLKSYLLKHQKKAHR